MSKAVKWLIVIGAMILFVAGVLLASVCFSVTLGPLAVFAVCAALYAAGYFWTRPPKDE